MKILSQKQTRRAIDAPACVDFRDVNASAPQIEHAEPDGLVICPKTSRLSSEQVLNLSELWEPRFQSPNLVGVALSGIEPAGKRFACDIYEWWKYDHERVAVLSVSPGSVQISFKRLWTMDENKIPETTPEEPSTPLFQDDNKTKRQISGLSLIHI